MKYCSKCGKEIHDEAVICVHCGCSVEGAQKETAESKMLGEFKRNVNSAFIFSIVGLVLVFGIGFIFSIISMIKCSQWKNFSCAGNLGSYEKIEFENLKKKLNTAEWISSISLVLFIIIMGILFTTALA